MGRIKTLNEISHLERSRFGRPAPRHGLKLLYWFANDFLSFDRNNKMFSDYDPDDGEFGFHLFENRYEKDGGKLLPDVDLPYYVVGNLSKDQSLELPDYVREDYTGLYDDSNMDRVIIRMDDEWLENVYVTEHTDRSDYNSDATYRISRGLLKVIQGLSFVDFLWRTGFSGESENKIQIPVEIRSPRSYIPQPKPPVRPMAITGVPAASSQRNQDICIEISPENDSPTQSSSVNKHKRKTFCNCTLL